MEYSGAPCLGDGRGEPAAQTGGSEWQVQRPYNLFRCPGCIGGTSGGGPPGCGAVVGWVVVKLKSSPDQPASSAEKIRQGGRAGVAIVTAQQIPG